MSSTKSLHRKRLSAEIEANGIEMAPCSGCLNAKILPNRPRPKCIVGPRSGKCSECVRKGVACDVTISSSQWERVRDTRDRLRRDLERVEEEETELLHRLAARRARKVRLRKQIRLAERRTDDAVAEELRDLESAEAVEETVLGPAPEGVEIEEYPFSVHGILEMPPADWASLFGEDPTDPLGGLLPLDSLNQETSVQ